MQRQPRCDTRTIQRKTSRPFVTFSQLLMGSIEGEKNRTGMDQKDPIVQKEDRTLAGSKSHNDS
jgi:hypothetical protein